MNKDSKDSSLRMVVLIDSVKTLYQRFKVRLTRDGLRLKRGPPVLQDFQYLYILYKGDPFKAQEARDTIKDYLANPDLFVQQSADEQEAIQRTQGLVQQSVGHGEWEVAAKWRSSNRLPQKDKAKSFWTIVTGTGKN